MSNKSDGNAFERELCKLLAENGYWAHNMIASAAGQPADIIAVKEQMAYLIDCKVCANDVFEFSRIESNQHTAMSFWESKGNGTGWFALKFADGSVWMYPYVYIKALHYGKKHIDKESVRKDGFTFEGWVSECGL